MQYLLHCRLCGVACIRAEDLKFCCSKQHEEIYERLKHHRSTFKFGSGRAKEQLRFSKAFLAYRRAFSTANGWIPSRNYREELHKLNISEPRGYRRIFRELMSWTCTNDADVLKDALFLKSGGHR